MNINEIKGMNNSQFVAALRNMNACCNAVEWASSHGGTPAELWHDCERGDWMGWIIGTCELHESPQKLAACLADVLAPIAKLLPSATTVEKTLRLYARGKATIEDVEAAGWAAGWAAGRAAEAAGRAAGLKKSASVFRRHYPLF